MQTPARSGAAFTIVEVLASATILTCLAIAFAAALQIVAKRMANDRTRYALSNDNARAVHVISELARRSSSVSVYTNLTYAMNGSAPAATGDVLAFNLPDGSRRFVSFESDTINFYTDSLPNPLTLAGGTSSNVVRSVGSTPFCAYLQGLAQARWLAKAETSQGWTEQITYSAFAVPVRNH